MSFYLIIGKQIHQFYLKSSNTPELVRDSQVFHVSSHKVAHNSRSQYSRDLSAIVKRFINGIMSPYSKKLCQRHYKYNSRRPPVLQPQTPSLGCWNQHPRFPPATCLLRYLRYANKPTSLASTIISIMIFANLSHSLLPKFCPIGSYMNINRLHATPKPIKDWPIHPQHRPTRPCSFPPSLPRQQRPYRSGIGIRRRSPSGRPSCPSTRLPRASCVGS